MTLVMIQNNENLLIFKTLDIEVDKKANAKVYYNFYLHFISHIFYLGNFISTYEEINKKSISVSKKLYNNFLYYNLETD